MKAIKYLFFNAQDGKPMPSVYTALVKPGESFFGNRDGIELRRCKEMIVREGELVMQPRRIRKRRDGKWQMAYGWPRGRSWSQGSMVAPIHVTEIITKNKNMDREMLKVVAVRYFEDRIKAAPDTLRFISEDHGVREFKLEATLAHGNSRYGCCRCTTASNSPKPSTTANSTGPPHSPGTAITLIISKNMSTRATIGMTLPNEMIVCVYCYRDGYPEHLGNILAKHYDTEEKIKELMKGGHLTDIETKQELCSYEHKGGAPVADDCRPVTRRNLGDFIQKVRDFGHDYGYIFRDGQWHIYNPNE